MSLHELPGILFMPGMCLKLNNEKGKKLIILKQQYLSSWTNRDTGNKNITAYDVNIYTFHALAYQEIFSSKPTGDIVSYNLARYLIYKKLRDLRAFNYGRDYVIGDIVPKLENAIRYIKSFGISPEDIEEYKNKIVESLRNKYNSGIVKNISLDEEEYLFDYFYQAFEYYEENKKSPDFNDLLFEFHKMKDKNTYDYVFVDELQDVNDIESRIAMSTGNVKFLVGDRKQSIFGFYVVHILKFINKYSNRIYKYKRKNKHSWEYHRNNIQETG